MVKRRKPLKKMKPLIIKRDKRGFIKSIENPNLAKKRGTVVIAQTLSSKPSENFVIRSDKRPFKRLGFARTERGAYDLALRKKKKRKVIFLD